MISMNLKNRFRLVILNMIALLFSIAVIVTIGIRLTNEYIQESNSMDSLVINLNELRVLNSEYLATPSERIKQQWWHKYDQLKSNQVGLYNMPDDVKDAFNGLQQIFEHLISLPNAEPEAEKSKNRLRSVIVTNLNLESQRIIDWASDISGQIKTKKYQQLMFIDASMFAIILLFALVTTAIMLVTTRRIISSINLLKDGAIEIASGNLGFQVKQIGNDEITSLTTAINRMSCDLMETYNDLHEQTVLLETEVSEKQIINKELQESEGKHRLLFESAGDAIFIHNSGGIMLAVNPTACERLGYSFSELMSLPVGSVDTPEQSRYMPDRVARLMEQGQFTFETVHRRKNGSLVPTEVSSRLITWGSQSAIMSICRDISERKQAEAKIHQLNADLEQRVIERTAQLIIAYQAMESFAYSVSHDLRAPLRSIDGFSMALQEDYADKLDEGGKDYLRRVRAATQKMAQLIDDILKLSRITRTELTIETVNLSKLAGTIADELHSAEPDRKVEFLITKGLKAKGDSRLLKVVLDNLLGNAWKFTSGHAEARIEFGSSKVDGKTVYFVRDDGAGFETKYADKLFVTFQRLHTEQEFSGTGIGLSLVQHIIHRHGGTVWAEGAVEQGATFWFTVGG